MKPVTTGLLMCLTLLQACGRETPVVAPAAPEPPVVAAAPAAAPATLEPAASTNPRADGLEQIGTSHPWFDVFRLSEQVYAIQEPGQFENVISYLVIGSSQALLFDSGLGIGDIRSVVRGLTRLPLMLLNSNSHYEHIGGNHQFDTILGRNLAFTKQQARGLSHAQVAAYVSESRLSRRHPPHFEASTYQVKPYHFSRWVNQGQVLDLGGISLEVLFCPGHSKDSICLLDRDNRRLFTGDTFYPGTVDLTGEGASLAAFSATVTQLAALADQVDVLLTGHHTVAVPAANLQALQQAVESINAGTARSTQLANQRQYNFDGFAIVTGDTP